MVSDAFEYDVAISFAEADQATAQELADLLNTRNIKVFLDEYGPPNRWGDIVDHLVNLYARKACYCVLLISQHYPLRAWTKAERTSAREHALRDAEEFILPIRLDDTVVPGIMEVKGYRNLNQHSMDSIVDFLEGNSTKQGGVLGRLRSRMIYVRGMFHKNRCDGSVRLKGDCNVIITRGDATKGSLHRHVD